jgi:hypothetical protein
MSSVNRTQTHRLNRIERGAVDLMGLTPVRDKSGEKCRWSVRKL